MRIYFSLLLGTGRSIGRTRIKLFLSNLICNVYICLYHICIIPRILVINNQKYQYLIIYAWKRQVICNFIFEYSGSNHNWSVFISMGIKLLHVWYDVFTPHNQIPQAKSYSWISPPSSITLFWVAGLHLSLIHIWRCRRRLRCRSRWSPYH